MITTFDRIVDKENFKLAHEQQNLGKTKYTQGAIEFNRNATYNLERLRQEVISGEYQFGDYSSFYVYEPKERLIHAPSFRDKIVQCAVNNIIKEIYFPKFIKDSYSCIDGKGTLNCANRISEFMKNAHKSYGEKATIVKIDIKKFFYSINREIMKEILKIKLKCNKTIGLIFKIIDSASKISEKGLPLGNTISQICANVYMDVIDQFCKRRESIKYYVRYADDIVMIVKNKDYAKEILNKVIDLLKNKLDLEVNKNKTKIFSILQGINIVGFKIYIGYRLLRDDCKRKIKRKLKKFSRLISIGRITIFKAEQMINSWLGHAKNGNSSNFISYLMNRFRYLYYDKKRNLRISSEFLKGGFYAYS